MSEQQKAYAIWYDNSSGWYEPFSVITADSPRAAIIRGRNQGLGASVVVVATAATRDHNGFGNDPNANPNCVLVTQ